ncbi:MAG: hypothetical protein QM754_17455 [Tepidisphaeraceae bacterium]
MAQTLLSTGPHKQLDEARPARLKCGMSKNAADERSEPFPTTPDWWQGEWPTTGIQTIEHLCRWVSERLDEFIFLSGESSQSMQRLSIATGQQAVRNATRWLNRVFGDEVLELPTTAEQQDEVALERSLDRLMHFMRITISNTNRVTLASSEVVALSPTEQQLLQAIFELGGNNTDRRLSRDAIVTKAIGPRAQPDSYKKPFARLCKLKLTQSQSGPGGGYCLTKLGRCRAERLRKG